MEDFEFIILDDGSTDETGVALREWQLKDGRIQVFSSERKLGLAGSSNYVGAQAKAPLIARMNVDDVSHPGSLEATVGDLSGALRRAARVGTLWEVIDARGKRDRPRDRWRLVRRSTFAPFTHGSVMFRRRAFDQVGGYREVCDFWEDLDLFLRMATTGQVFVIPDALYEYRFHTHGSRLAVDRGKVENAVGLMCRCLSKRRAGRDYSRLLLERGRRNAPDKRCIPPGSLPSDRPASGPDILPAFSTRFGDAARWRGTAREYCR